MGVKGRYYYKGFYAEHALMKRLRRAGFWCARLPRSGKSYGFDLIAMRGGKALFIEVKRRSDFVNIYLPKEKVILMREKVKKAGAIGLLALYVSSIKEWFVRDIKSYDHIYNKNYRYDSNSNWIPLDEYLESL